MSPINQLSVLAFAAGALAVPGYRDNHGHNHNRFHSSGSAAGTGRPEFPYPVANATGNWGSTGTGSAPTGYSSVAAPSYSGPVVVVSPVPAGSSSSLDTYVNAASTTECTTDVTVTTTQKTYVTITATEDASSSVEVSATQNASSSTRSQSTITVQSTVYYTPSSSASAGFSSSANASSNSRTTLTVQSTVYLTSSTSSEASSSTADASTPSGPAAYTPQTSSEASSTSSTSSTEVAPVTTAESTTSSEAAPSSYVAESSTSSEAAPSSYSEVVKAHSYSALAPSSYVAPTASSSSVYVAPTTSSSSVYVAPTTSAVVSSAYSTSSATSSSAAASPTSYSGGGGKRGLSYNDASLCSGLMSSPHVGWAYNWGSENGGFTPSSSVNYIPTMWGLKMDFESVWSDNAQAAIDAGSEYLFSFNEPDMSTQANMSPEDAAAAYKTYMEPFAGKAKLCAPSVTNGGGEMGLTWLTNFLAACDGCTIDCVNIHWYAESSLTDYFKEQVTNATTVSGKPVFVSEFAPTDGSDSDKSDFLQEVMPWMDSNNDVLGYAYFMVADGMLMSGTSPSSFGSTYLDYSS
ncbi:hypothetical protein LTR10_013889 [Elasticomyces elasticus]|nr:hypothetical protein LTR10_013889 [Elasticomyces elasticus]KAK4974527.1 hypothetical protein LTR42_005172 [Elasticomyces elasticus]